MSLTLSRSLGLGKLGVGCGRDDEDCTFERGAPRNGMGSGEAVGLEGAADIARGVGNGTGDCSAIWTFMAIETVDATQSGSKGDFNIITVVILQHRKTTLASVEYQY